MREAAEFDLIAAIGERLAAAGAGARDGERIVIGSGDDAAVTVPGGATATSVDAIVEGVHFRREWSTPQEIGHKALAAALSDLAAMGAEPGEAYVWLGLPEGFGRSECLQLADGIAGLAARHRVAVLGGDITAAPVLALAATVVGHAAEPGTLVGRDRAGEGELVCVTGELGAAAAGLRLLESGLEPSAARGAEADALTRLLRPEPRLEAGRLLAEAGATAMIDLSDGLGADAAQLAAASEIGIEIDLERVPVAASARELAGEHDWELAELITGGEDYELLCTLPADALDGAREALSAAGEIDLSPIGQADGSEGARIRRSDGRRVPAGGHDHLAR